MRGFLQGIDSQEDLKYFREPRNIIQKGDSAWDPGHSRARTTSLSGCLFLCSFWTPSCFCPLYQKPQPITMAPVWAQPHHLGLPLGGCQCWTSHLWPKEAGPHGPGQFLSEGAVSRVAIWNPKNPLDPFSPGALVYPSRLAWPHLTPGHCLSWMCSCEQRRRNLPQV